MGLDIPVDNPPAVGMLQRLGNLGGKMQCLPPGKRAALLHILLQRQPVDQLHDDVVNIVGVVDVINRHNIGMRQHGNCLGFRIKPSAEVLVPAQLLLKNFYRHIAVEPMAPGAVNHCHTASADLLQNFITAV